MYFHVNSEFVLVFVKIFLDSRPEYKNTGVSATKPSVEAELLQSSGRSKLAGRDVVYSRTTSKEIPRFR